MFVDLEKAKAIFFQALEEPSARQRRTAMAAACGEDSELRQQVEILLDAHEQAGSFLGSPVVE